MGNTALRRYSLVLSGGITCWFICILAINAGADQCVDMISADQVRFYWLEFACPSTITASRHVIFDMMPSIYITRMLLVAIGLCSAIVGKASAVSLSDASLLSMPNPLISFVKEWTVDNRLMQTIWHDDGKTFNITMDKCISWDAVVGIYQFANGTSKNDTTIEEIDEDLIEFAGTSPRLRETRFAAQFLANSQLANNEIEALIDDRVPCGDMTVSGADRTELRSLLAIPDGYWAAVIVKGFVAAGVAGAGVAITKAVDSLGVRLSIIFTIAYLGVLLAGITERAQRDGRMNHVGALLGLLVSAITRQEVGRVSHCNADIENGLRSTTSYLTTTSSLTSSQSAMPSPSDGSAMSSLNYESAISSLGSESVMSSIMSWESASASFHLEHPADGLQCQL